MTGNRLVWFCSLLCVLALGLTGCEDDEDTGAPADPDAHSHSGEGGHSDHHGEGGCGIQSNCMDTETLASGLVVAGGDYEVMVQSHDDLTGDLDNEWMIMLRDGDGNALADTDFTASTYSEDCEHGGPTAPDTVTTDAMGMATIKPTFAHGGPWSVRIDVNSDDSEGSQDIMIQLCVPGADHDGNHGDDEHGEHGEHSDGEHSEHSDGEHSDGEHSEHSDGEHSDGEHSEHSDGEHSEDGGMHDMHSES